MDRSVRGRRQLLGGVESGDGMNVRPSGAPVGEEEVIKAEGREKDLDPFTRFRENG